MRTVVVYKDKTDYARQVEEYLHDFKQLTGRDIEVMNPETLEGISFCQTYGILQYPTLIALADNGQMQNMWKGLPLPTLSEVSYYA